MHKSRLGHGSLMISKTTLELDEARPTRKSDSSAKFQTMLLLQVLLLASFQVITVLAQLGSSVCFGTGSICDAALNVTCPSDINNATVLLACYCPTKLPLQQA